MKNIPENISGGVFLWELNMREGAYIGRGEGSLSCFGSIPPSEKKNAFRG
jgi:hypothetical protein